MTAIFTDIRGFSTISEKLDANQLVALLNRYLSTMSDIVLERQGTIDKYEGDAIIAFFGAPLDLPTHASAALGSPY
jgi:adenylate cyclase